MMVDQLPALQTYAGESVHFLGAAGSPVAILEFRARWPYRLIDVEEHLPPSWRPRKAPDDVYVVANPQDARLVLRENGAPAVAWSYMGRPFVSDTDQVLAMALECWRGFGFQRAPKWALDYADRGNPTHQFSVP
jgi:hypothetical protein